MVSEGRWTDRPRNTGRGEKERRERGRAEGRMEGKTKGRKEEMRWFLTSWLQSAILIADHFQFHFKTQKSQSICRGVPRRRIWAPVYKPTELLLKVEFISCVYLSKLKAVTALPRVPLFPWSQAQPCRFFWPSKHQKISPKKAISHPAGHICSKCNVKQPGGHVKSCKEVKPPSPLVSKITSYQIPVIRLWNHPCFFYKRRDPDTKGPFGWIIPIHKYSKRVDEKEEQTELGRSSSPARALRVFGPYYVGLATTPTSQPCNT